MAMETLVRALVGGVAGLAAVAAKFVGQDMYYLSKWAYSPLVDDVRNFKSLILLYVMMVPVLIFLGALVCWATDEKNRLKLIALGVAAPAMITTFAGGPKSDLHDGSVRTAYYDINPISAAFAQTDLPNCTDNSASLAQGAKLFFGLGGAEKYWVIVGSFTNKNEAEQLARNIESRHPEMRPFVGKRAPCNEFYPVIVGDYVPYADAVKLTQESANLNPGSRPYLSAYPDRKP
jgi:hypothetical protein